MSHEEQDAPTPSFRQNKNLHEFVTNLIPQNIEMKDVHVELYEESDDGPNQCSNSLSPEIKPKRK
jgi:hypothetical protein